MSIKKFFTRGGATLLACLMCLLIKCASSAPHQNKPILKYNEIGWYTPSGSVEVWHCTSCLPGYGLSVQCGKMYPFGTKIDCVLCKKGHTFSDTYDINQCHPCTRCQKNEIQIGQCKPEKDTTQCQCKPGYYRDHSASCKPCSWCCGDNKTNEQVPECKHLEKKCSFQTAKSCEPTTLPPSTLPFSPSIPDFSPTIKSTTRQTRKTEFPVNNSFSSVTDSNDSESNRNDYQKTQKKLAVKGSKGKMQELLAKIAFSIGGVIVLACLAFGVNFYYRQRSSDPIDRDPAEDIYVFRSTSSTSDSTTNVESHVTSPLLDDQGVSNNNDVNDANVDLNAKNGTAKYVPLDHKMQARKEAHTLPGTSGTSGVSGVNFQSSLMSCTSATTPSIQDNNAQNSPTHKADTLPGTSGGVSGVNFQRSLTSCTCATTPRIQDNNAQNSPTHKADTLPETSGGVSGVNFQRSLTSCTCATTPSIRDNNAQNSPIKLSKEQKFLKQVTDLPLDIYNKVCARLDAEDHFFHDYRMLAEKLGVSNDQIRILGQRTSKPTHSLLTEHKLKLNHFAEILEDIARGDVMEIIEAWLNH